MILFILRFIEPARIRLGRTIFPFVNVWLADYTRIYHQVYGTLVADNNFT